MRLFIVFFALVISGFIINCEDEQSEITGGTNKKEQSFFMDELLGINPWVPLYFIDPEDTSHVLKVFYSDEMNMTQKTIYCKLIIENDKTKEYRLVAPWFGESITLQKANVLDLTVMRVPITEMTER